MNQINFIKDLFSEKIRLGAQFSFNYNFRQPNLIFTKSID